jgi:hypothetical protein
VPGGLLERLIEGPEDNAEAAAAEDLQHLVVADVAEQIGTGGGERRRCLKT